MEMTPAGLKILKANFQRRKQIVTNTLIHSTFYIQTKIQRLLLFTFQQPQCCSEYSLRCSTQDPGLVQIHSQGVSSPSVFVRRRKTLIGVCDNHLDPHRPALFRRSNYPSSGLQVSSIFDPTGDNADDEWYHRLLGKSKPRPQGAFGPVPSMDNFADRQCGDNYAHTNPDHTKDYIRKWTSMTDSTIIAWRHKWQKYIASPQVKMMDMLKGNFQGRGILFTAGNKDTYDRVMTTLRILRIEYKCRLPAEVWYFKGRTR